MSLRGARSDGLKEAKAVGSMWHGTIRSQNVGTFHPRKDVGQISVGRCGQGEAQWNRELVRHSGDLRFEGFLMRYLEEFLKEGRLSVWASMKVREC